MKYLKEFDSIGKLQKHYKSNLYVTPNVYITKDNQKVDMTSDDEIVCVYDITDLNGNPNLWGAYTNLNNLFESIVIDGVKWDNLNNPAQSSNYYDSNKSSNIHIIKFKLKVKDFSGLMSAPLVTGNHLEYVYLPEGFKNISDNMFNGCNFLKQIHIPNSLVSISTSAFYNCSSLKEIHLNEGLLSIGQNAFSGCSSLEKINFPYTLKDGVGSNYHSSFNGCPLKYLYVDTTLLSTFYGSPSFPYSNLETLEFGPHAFTSEGRCQFNFGGYSFNNTNIKFDEGLVYVPGMGGCSGVNEIILPTTAKEFAGTFGGCSINLIDLSNTQISSLQYRSGTSYSYGYYGNPQPNYSNPFPGSGLRKIILNNLITDIPTYCFAGCSNLTEINIPDSVMNIGDWVFSSCSNLTTVHMSEIVRNRITNHDVFYGCYSLSDSYVENGIRYIDINDNVGTDFIRIEDKTLEEYTIKTNYLPGIYSSDIPNCKTLRFTGEFTEIIRYGFSGYTQLETVILPSTLTSIGDFAFKGCTNLETLEIPNTVTTIGENVFAGTKLSSITIPEGVTEISDETFMNCTSLTEVTLPSTLTSIGASAFQGCSELETLIIPSSVTTIGENAFVGTKLGTIENGIKYFDTGSDILALSIADKTLSSYNIKNGTTRIEFTPDAWSDVNNIESITLPNTLTYVPNNSFNDICNILTDNQVDFILGINADAIKYGYILLRKPKSYFENEYLCIIPKEDNLTIHLKKSIDTVYYSDNKGTTWNVIGEYSNNPWKSKKYNKGDVILFKNSDNPRINNGYSSLNSGVGTINVDKEAYICGNIMSMEYGDNFANQTTIESTKKYMFAYLFQNNTVNINIDKLILPATTLSEYCYSNMFNGCTSLTSTPELPATTLMNGCYYFMFEGCTSLTNVPELPATTLASSCYLRMFGNCTSLTNVPELPATTLASSCYSAMFRGCTSLTTIPSNYLPVTTLEDSCYSNMFYGCTSLTTVPSNLLPATTLAQKCYQYMFTDCTSLTSAPELLATTLTTQCYYYMFSGCTSLKYVKCLATDISASNCTYYWLNNVNSFGRIMIGKNNIWSEGYNGIPRNWIKYNELISNDDFVGDIQLSTNEYITFTANSSSLIGINSLAGAQQLYLSNDSINWKKIYIDDNKLYSFDQNDIYYVCGNLTNNVTNGNNTSFYIEGDVDVSGNCNSIWNKDNLLADLKESCGSGMFANCTGLKNAINLVLPATTLSDRCYASMFSGCTSLVTAPELPATTLESYCYVGMFEGCTSLVTAPKLPATTLTNSCYASMFANCTSLVTTPELPATTLTNSCYANMFQGCTSLTTVPELLTTTLSNNCYQYMFYGCTSLTTVPSNLLPATTLATYCYYHMFGDCTSLVNAPELPATTLASYCYDSMFRDCTSLAAIPELPATTLANNCYQSMFQDCTSLTTIPELPATTLASNCYHYMFQGCTSLTTALKLPATTLANNCYQSMFKDCTSLTTAPELPATTLADSCYDSMFMSCTSLVITPNIHATKLPRNSCRYMFYDCTSLTTIGQFAPTIVENYCCWEMFERCTSLVNIPSILPATTLADSCYYFMFSGCTSLTTAPELPATTLSNQCYYYMFQGCTSLTTAPELLAITLASNCYSYMFKGCSSLNYVKCLATNISASNCVKNWLDGVSKTGTFVKKSSMNSWTTGKNGIPSGWTVQNA